MKQGEGFETGPGNHNVQRIRGGRGSWDEGTGKKGFESTMAIELEEWGGKTVKRKMCTMKIRRIPKKSPRK